MERTKNVANAFHVHPDVLPAPCQPAQAATKAGAWTKKASALLNIVIVAIHRNITKMATASSAILRVKLALDLVKIIAFPVKHRCSFKENAVCISATMVIIQWRSPLDPSAYLVCILAKRACLDWTALPVKMDCNSRVESAGPLVLRGKFALEKSNIFPFFLLLFVSCLFVEFLFCYILVSG